MTDEKPKANGKGNEPALHFGRMTPIDHKWNEHAVIIPADTDPKQLLARAYFRHYANQLRAGDILTCFWEDGSYEASYRVMFVSKAEVAVSERWHCKHIMVDVEEETATYEVKWRGPTAKWCVIAKATSDVVKSGFEAQEQAHDAIRKMGPAQRL